MEHLTQHTDYLGGLLIFVTFAIFMYLDKLPSVETFDRFLHSLDSKGGNILILTALSVFFTAQAIKFFWHLEYAVEKGLLAGDKGVHDVAVAFLTNTLAAGALGALYKTLSGSSEPLSRKVWSPEEREKANGGNNENAKTTPAVPAGSDSAAGGV